MTPEDLSRTVTEALRAHHTWRARLTQAVDTGTLPKPAREIACDHACGFGQWLHDLKADPELAAEQGYRQVVRAHADFHSEAGRIAAMVEAGDRRGAEAALNGPGFVHISEALTQASADWAVARAT